MIQQIHHVQITIPPGREDEARFFYGGLLGLHEIAKPPTLRARGGLWFAVGERELHIGVEDGVARAATKAHVAYRVDDLDAIRVRLEHAGHLIGRSIPIAGYRRFECRDPFGNRVEFIQPLENEESP